jgi:hypothetical protein
MGHFLKEKRDGRCDLRGARTPAPVAESVQAEPRKSFFARFMDALRETRRQQARREIATRAPVIVGLSLT